MADGEFGQANIPSPLRGAALRQAKQRERSIFLGPSSYQDGSHGLWTQFSGMPSQPGASTSLHEWLQSVDNASHSGNASPSLRGFSDSTSSSAGPFDSFSADFLSTGLDQDRSRGITSHLDMTTHHFDFGPQTEFVSSSDYQTVPDFTVPHSPHFSHSPMGPFSPAPSEISGLPPNFSQHSHDLSFGTQPDIFHPAPFLCDVPLRRHTVDYHQGLSDCYAVHSENCYQDTSLSREDQHAASLSRFDASLTNQSVLRPHDILPGHIGVTLPPSSFAAFPVKGDDLFQNSVDFDIHEQSDISNYEEVAPAQKKIIRQNSEPIYGRDEGKTAYVEALGRLNSFGPSGQSYDPFGSTVQLQEDPVESSSVLNDDSLPSKLIKRKEPSRPSYSEVAKAAKGKSAQVKADTSVNEKEQECLMKTSSDIPPSKSYRHPTTRWQFSHTRITNQRVKSGHSEGIPGNYMQPNSRYGLDKFEDSVSFVPKEQRSSSMESLNSQLNQAGMRRSSNSSHSSSTSAVEENHLPKSSGSLGSGAVDAKGSRYRDKSFSLNSKEATQNSTVYNNNSSSSVASSAGQPPPRTSASPMPSTTQKLKNDRLFFDPKRIFQSHSSTRAQEPLNKTKVTEEGRRGGREGLPKEETVLNNGKPNNTTVKASAASHRKTDYINNDLREGSSGSAGGGSSGGSNAGGGSGKRTNQTATFNRPSSRKHSSKDSVAQNGSSADRYKGTDSRSRRQDNENNDGNSFIRNIDWVLVDEWMKYISDCSMAFARNSCSAVLTLLLYLLGIVMYLVLGAVHMIALAGGKLWSLARSRIFKDSNSDSWTGCSRNTDTSRRRFGVEENITLPATGEEAMKRLLACKGKDPYSILGLRADATDEDIKRYYRRQAVLVHPDKNQEPGAEEAFKILGHAFEMIGEPAKRKEYDAHIYETSEAEAAMREFSDLLTQLHEKVQEAANMMRCENCGGKHRRVPVDRPWYSARFCDRCNIHHSAKEGDVWAESSMFGFLWHYYACMDNSIYDITDWVSCQKENFKHMQANAHPVFYRIQTNSNRRHRSGQSGDVDLEDFINRLFHKTSGSPDGASHSGWQFPSQQAGTGTSQSSWGATASTSSKRSRRKKKKN